MKRILLIIVVLLLSLNVFSETFNFCVYHKSFGVFSFKQVEIIKNEKINVTMINFETENGEQKCFIITYKILQEAMNNYILFSLNKNIVEIKEEIFPLIKNSILIDDGEKMIFFGSQQYTKSYLFGIAFSNIEELYLFPDDFEKLNNYIRN